jgi:DNA repair protein RecO (recombination protein O)
MEWTDEGIVIGVRRHGEANAVVELMTRSRGRHLGLVRGGAGKRLTPVLQPGNGVQATWRARLDEHLGTYMIEGLTLRAAGLIASPHALFGLTHLAALTRLLPERDPHEGLYAALGMVLDRLDDPALAGPLVLRYELEVLKELGFGLDLSQCAATGATEDLAYISPKSGRAVSRAAGAPWHERLFALPGFLVGAGEADEAALTQAYRMSGHFLARDVLDPRGLPMPESRAAFLSALRRAALTPP